MERTRERYWKGSKSEHTAVHNAQMVVNILGPTRSPASIGTAQVEGLIGELRSRRLSDATINRKLASLSKMLRHGSNLGIIPKVPFIGRLRESQGRIRWLSQEEEAAVLARLVFLGRLDLRDLVILLIDTGARLGEIVGNIKAQPITWRDIDFEAPAIRFWDTKNGASRSVPLTDRAVAILRSRRQSCPLNQEAVFWNLDHWMAEKQWAHLRTSLQMDHDPQFVLHMLRHTFCSRLVQRGISIQVVQQLAGHKSLSVTLRYAHLHQSNLVEAIRGQQPQLTPMSIAG
jgi:site-specific recombinase XerD